ncbi:hypothetical protein, partial [Shewanella algae]
RFTCLTSGLRKWTRLEEFPKHLIEVFENSICMHQILLRRVGFDVYYQLSKLLKSGLKKAKDKY